MVPNGRRLTRPGPDPLAPSPAPTVDLLTPSSFDAAFERLYPRARIMAFRILGDVGRSEEIASEAPARAYARWSKLSTVDYLDACGAAGDGQPGHRRHPPAAAAAAGPRHRAIPGRSRSPCSAPRPRRGPAEPAAPPAEAIALRYLADLRESDVAEALGISLGSVKTHVHRGLDALRQRLGRRPCRGLDHVAPEGLPPLDQRPGSRPPDARAVDARGRQLQRRRRARRRRGRGRRRRGPRRRPRPGRRARPRT